MKNINIFLLIFILAIGICTDCQAQTPIKVSVPPYGETRTLQPLKTGYYEIGFILDENGNQVEATGLLYIENKPGTSLKVGMSLYLIKQLQKFNVTSMGTFQKWLTKDNSYITYEAADDYSSINMGYATVWAYSKKFNALKIAGVDSKGSPIQATVLYRQDSYKKMSDPDVTKTIMKIEDQPGSLYIYQND